MFEFSCLDCDPVVFDNCKLTNCLCDSTKFTAAETTTVTNCWNVDNNSIYDYVHNVDKLKEAGYIGTDGTAIGYLGGSNPYKGTREISGSIQQIEKYIFCLNSSDKAKEDVSKKLTEFLPEGVEVKIVNPQGILLAGRSKEFTDEQKKDFELIKRQYKHVADIMTYDDLAQRLKNIIASLEKRI